MTGALRRGVGSTDFPLWVLLEANENAEPGKPKNVTLSVGEGGNEFRVAFSNRPKRSTWLEAWWGSNIEAKTLSFSPIRSMR